MRPDASVKENQGTTNSDAYHRNRAYVLGHSEREPDRLSTQARLIDSITLQFFREAGIGSGMQVLDVGSGVGDVVFLVADLVGDSGGVIGTDKSPAAVLTATERAKVRGLRNVSFREGDTLEMSFDLPFDAIVGRYVLLFQADPAAMLRGLAKLLRTGEVMGFHEPDWESARSFPPAPTYDRCCRWITETFRRAGSDTNMAGRLYAAFVGAGVPAPTMRMQTFIGGGRGIADFLQAVAELVGAVLSPMERLGVATTAEVELATLAERLRREVNASDSLIIGRSEIGAWSRQV